MKKIISFTPLAAVFFIGFVLCQIESSSALLVPKAATVIVKPKAAPAAKSINIVHFPPLYCPQ